MKKSIVHPLIGIIFLLFMVFVALAQISTVADRNNPETITEINIKYVDFTGWKPEEVAQIQPIVLSLMSKIQAEQYFNNKIPEKEGFYKPTYTAEALVYTIMNPKLDASFVDLIGTEFGKGKIKTKEGIVEFGDKGIIIRRTKEGLKISGVYKNKGATFDLGYSIFKKGGVKINKDGYPVYKKDSSFEGRGFKVEDSTDEMVVGFCRTDSPVACIFPYTNRPLATRKETERLIFTPGKRDYAAKVEDGVYGEIEVEFDLSEQGGPLKLQIKKENGKTVDVLFQDGQLWSSSADMDFKSKITIQLTDSKARGLALTKNKLWVEDGEMYIEGKKVAPADWNAPFLPRFHYP